MGDVHSGSCQGSRGPSLLVKWLPGILALAVVSLLILLGMSMYSQKRAKLIITVSEAAPVTKLSGESMLSAAKTVTLTRLYPDKDSYKPASRSFSRTTDEKGQVIVFLPTSSYWQISVRESGQDRKVLDRYSIGKNGHEYIHHIRIASIQKGEINISVTTRYPSP